MVNKIWCLVVTLMLSMGMLSLSWYSILGNKSSLMFGMNVMESSSMNMSASFVFDPLSVIFGGVVGWIGGSVFVMTRWYMVGDKNWSKRFVMILFSFVMSMWVVIFSSDIVFMLVGWDGLGISSFILVIYYMNKEVLGSGLVTAFINRFGDSLLIVSLMAVSCEKEFLSGSMSWKLYSAFSLCSILFILGSVTKSAQVPFSSWLPEAMAAPTPVSTLVHSSTLVTAGVYIMIRFDFMLSYWARHMLVWISCLTMLIAGSSAVTETDVKKITALSTLSQVSLMAFCVGIQSYDVSFFHLCTHAFVKASLFMAVASMIYYSGGCQDMRIMGSLWLSLPESSALYLFMNLSLMGIPCSAVYFSKHLLLSYSISDRSSYLVTLLLIVAMFLTLVYSVRSFLWIVSNSVEVKEFSGLGVNQSWWMLGMLCLSSLSLVFGFLKMNVSQNLGFENFIMMNKFYYVGLLLVMAFSMDILLLALCSCKSKVLMKEMFSYMMSMKSVMGNKAGASGLYVAEKVNQNLEMSWISKKVWKVSFSLVYMQVSGLLRKASYSSMLLMILPSLVIFLLYNWYL